ALREQAQREQDRDGADWNVDPEDPVPVDSLRYGTAHEWSDGDGEAGEPAVDADDHPASLGGECRREDCEAEWQDDSSAEALQGAGSDQRRCVRCQGTGGRGEREQRQTDVEDTDATEAVAERRSRDDAGGERDPVRVDGPLQRGEADMQI